MSNTKKIFSDDEDDESDSMGTSKQQVNARPTKKRKRTKRLDEQDVADDIPSTPPSAAFEEGEKKKVKKEKKPKPKATPKKKAPLNLDKQCGVIIEHLNTPCTRSLTCKIHSMGAKRSVQGRSLPFNDLLATYQKKKSIGRPQQAVASASNDGNYGQQAVAVKPAEEEDGDVDSDEETEHVRLAIEHYRPRPLCQRSVYYVKRRREYYKLRDVLLEAITPKTMQPSTTIQN